MLPRFRNIVLLLLLTLNCGSLFAAVSATATLTVTGAEQPNGVWDSGNIAVSFNGFSETVNYSQFSSSASLASALAARFTRDYNRYGLWAKAGANANSDPTVVTFQLTNGDAFTSISYSVSTASFALAPSGFGSSAPVVADTGTITLQVNGGTVATAPYTDGTSPTLIAQSLQNAASSNLVTVQADGNLLYIASKQTGSSVDYPFSFTITHSSNTFPNPSFTISPMSDTLTGGANASSSSDPIYSYSITNSSGGSGYDHAGNILNLTDSVMGTWSYGYDNLNRLVSGQAATGAYAAQTPYLCWSYDSFGNRTHQSLSNKPFVNATGSVCQAATGASLADTATVPAPNNQVGSSLVPGASVAITPTYDAAGNLTFDGVNTYVYDAEERVCAVHGVFGMTGYQYDADGNRVGKGSITSMSCDITANGYQPTNDYVLDQSGGQMTELAVDENGTVAWQHTNVMADGRLIATYDLSGLHFYLDDPLGSRRAQTDSGGVLEQNCLSLPFGDQLNCTISTSGPTEHHFTGKERDAESGLDYSHYRYYASSMGRWTSPDPSGLTFANKYNPQSFNLYAYVNNNPLVFVDPTGLSTDCGGGGDKSVVCLVTTAFDKIKNWFGSSSSSSNTSVTTTTEESIPNQTPGTPIRTSPGYQQIVRNAFQGTEDAASKEAYMEGAIARGSIVGLTFLHSRETIMGYSDIESVQKMTTEQIIESLKPAGSQPMVVRSDGLIMNGNTRLFVLQERGFNIQSLNIPFLEHVPESIGWEGNAEAAEKAAAARTAAAEAEGEGGP